ncbi:MAG: hypothetical protein HKN03_14775 [Acidimicrobiales bacterium]|nr:hypothetical protein [Acidimicrobiales bacterium]
MNLGAHVTVAAALGADPWVHLGSALPDIATIGGFRMLPGSGSGKVGDGIALHHATDEAFHSHAWFLERQKNVFDHLTDQGVRRGAARASAHVGVELLLDGELFGGNRSEARAGAVNAALLLAGTDPGLGQLVPTEMRPDWLLHLGQLHRWRPPTYFADPAAVAVQMKRILERRPRLAMTQDEVPKVEKALAAVQPSIVETAEAFLGELTELLQRSSP